MIRETNRVWINIHLDSLHRNLDLLRTKIAEDTKVMAIVKADAYGHGALVVAQEIADNVDWFGVATPEEALILRKKGIRNPILVLGVVRPSYYSELIENSVRFSLFSWQDAVLCSKAAEYLGREAMIHIKWIRACTGSVFCRTNLRWSSSADS